MLVTTGTRAAKQTKGAQNSFQDCSLSSKFLLCDHGAKPKLLTLD